jgi:aryl carrier-like protein
MTTVDGAGPLIDGLITDLTGQRLGPDEGFFAAGLTSATVVALHQRLTAALGVEFELTTLFKYPTIRGLARFLADPDAHAAGRRPVVRAPAPDGTADARRALRARIQQRNR